MVFAQPGQGIHRRRQDGPAEADGFNLGGKLEVDCRRKLARRLRERLCHPAMIVVIGWGTGQRQAQQPHAVGEAAQIRAGRA